MYLIKEEKIKDIKKYRTSFYKEKTGLALSYVSGAINRKIKCSEITAKAILSVCFDISFYNEQMDKLLKEYFKEE